MQILNPDSNLCFGEGGAGTWSDGKLTTRIGKNSEDVQVVLRLLVRHGAPPQILVTGKPHLGTDRLVRLLKQLRAHLQGLGADFLFNSTVSDLDVQGGMVRAVVLATGEHIEADRVVLAVGHSARELCTLLQQRGVRLEA
ncbi:FAD-dependent oxidoreductase, partial [archaeon]